uniref:Uncharacterized protein n=1 Tax=Arundo donax TaxID=35708 RepID=A0A0A9GEV8_ARUDO
MCQDLRCSTLFCFQGPLIDYRRVICIYPLDI